MKKMSTKTKRKLDPTMLGLIVGAIVVIVGINVYFGSFSGISPASPVSEPTLEDVQQTVEGMAAAAGSTERQFLTLEEKERMFSKYKELAGITGYINAEEGLTIKSLLDDGKVVLVDFWTYSCINCQRTTPYLNAWYEEYKDEGLAIVGVHSPEFEFEKDYDNVLEATKRMGIGYPVVQDNGFETWRAYDNRYWPRKYIIDSDGFVRFDHIGEGAYEQTEDVIRDLLTESAGIYGDKINMSEDMVKPKDLQDVEFGKIGTPELYLGYKFARAPLGNSESFKPEQEHEYSAPGSDKWQSNLVYLTGKWRGYSDYVQLTGGSGAVGLKYAARSVNIVAGGKGSIEVLLDGKPVGANDAGNDVLFDKAEIDGNTLYNLVYALDYGAHTLELKVEGDVQIYTFTFG